MGIIVQIDEDDLIPDYKQLTYKLNKAVQYLDEAFEGYKLIEKNQDAETGEHLLYSGLTFARAFVMDSLNITRGPDYIDWM